MVMIDFVCPSSARSEMHSNFLCTNPILYSNSCNLSVFCIAMYPNARILRCTGIAFLATQFRVGMHRTCCSFMMLTAMRYQIFQTLHCQQCYHFESQCCGVPVRYTARGLLLLEMLMIIKYAEYIMSYRYTFPMLNKGDFRPVNVDYSRVELNLTNFGEFLLIWVCRHIDLSP